MRRAKRKQHWSYVTGERGRNRVRAFEHSETGRIFLEVREPVARGERARTRRVALGHSARERAKAAANLSRRPFRQQLSGAYSTGHGRAPRMVVVDSSEAARPS